MEQINISYGVINYYVSIEDAICISTHIKDLISIRYLYTDAGSNPREFQGMTSTNIKILSSILIDPHRFWAKHLGVALTIKGDKNNFNKHELRGILTYEDACITNGLQTLSLFRILVMIKVFQKYKNKPEIHQKIPENSEEIINEILPTMAEFFLMSINASQVNKVLYWFHKEENKKYLNIFNSMEIDDILSIRIAVKSVQLDRIMNKDEEKDIDVISSWGDTIANDNNETQNVKPDDKFGTKYQQWLEENIMNYISNKKINIEYRNFSKQKLKLPSKHILEVLRAIIPTTFIIDLKTSEEDKTNVASHISKYANNRTPVYSVFEKLIKIANLNGAPKEVWDVINIIKNLMPELIEIMLEFRSKLSDYYLKLNSEEILKNITLSEKELGMRLGIQEDNCSKSDLDEAVKKYLKFSESNIFPIFVFATKKSIQIHDRFKVSYDISSENIKNMIEAIYRILLKQKLNRQYSSTSDLFRNPESYVDAEFYYKALNKNDNIDYTEKFRINLANY